MVRDTRLDIDYSAPTNATVIWLHGLGADGRDFAQMPAWLGRAHTRYVLPDAPLRPLTLHGGATTRAWFDLYGLGPESPVDWAGLEAARTQVTELIAAERARAQQPLVLGGFSQGGALALYTGLSLDLGLAGIVGLSTYLPRVKDDQWLRHDAPPVFLAHGAADTVIPLPTAQRTVDRLRQHGLQPEWSTWPMGHSVHPEELVVLARWLTQVLQ